MQVACGAKSNASIEFTGSTQVTKENRQFKIRWMQQVNHIILASKFQINESMITQINCFKCFVPVHN